MAALPTLDEFKAYLNATTGNTGNGGDTELTSFLSTATDLATDLIGAIAPTTVVEDLDGGAPTVVLSKPVISITGIVELYGNLPQTITQQQMDSDPTTWTGYGFSAKGPVLTRRANGRLARWAPGSSNIIVTYSAGLSPVPSFVHDGILELAKHLYRSQTGSRKGQATEWSPQLAYAIPNRVKEQLRPVLWGPDFG